MKITYDPLVNAAYIYLKDQIGYGEVGQTIPLDTLPLNIDLDSQGYILGIEVLNATTVLSAELLSSAEVLLY